MKGRLSALQKRILIEAMTQNRRVFVWALRKGRRLPERVLVPKARDIIAAFYGEEAGKARPRLNGRHTASLCRSVRGLSEKGLVLRRGCGNMDGHTLTPQGEKMALKLIRAMAKINNKRGKT